MAVTLFLNSFLSYLMLFFVIVVVAGAAVTIGITLRRKKNVSQRDAVQETVSEKK